MLLLLYGLLTLFVASAFGPGNSDELVTEGPELVPWYGLPFAGTFAAIIGLALVSQPRRGSVALSVAAIALGAWTVFTFLVAE